MVSADAPAPIDVYPRQVTRAISFRAPWRDDRLVHPGDRFHLRGRYALYHGLLALSAPGDRRDTVLLPAWHCRTQVLAVQHAGLRWRFFPVEADGSVDPRRIEALIDRDTLAVSLTHYHGWPAPVDRLRRLTLHHGVYLIEDCAHALGSPACGVAGDVAVYSLRKSLPVPDGGLLRFNHRGLRPPPRFPGDLGLRPAAGAALRAMGVDAEVARLRRAWPLGRRHASAEPTAGPRFDPHLAHRSASMFTRLVLHATSASRLVAGRRAAFLALDRRLRHHPRFKPLHGRPTDEACPLALVLRHPERDRLEASLAAQGIASFCFGRDHHPSLRLAEHPETTDLLRETLALPTHQELGHAELDRMARVLHDLL